MIRAFNNDDIKQINNIGKSIKENFDLLKVYNANVENVYIYEQNNNILGFIHINNIYNDVDIINVAVLEKNRNQGIASSLIKYIIEEIKPNKIMLEVRKSNIRAINFYVKNYFKIIHERKNYYGNESALIMELIIK